MTVEELIEELNKCDPKLKVYIIIESYNPDEGYQEVETTIEKVLVRSDWRNVLEIIGEKVL